MPSNIQLAEAAIDTEHVRIGSDRPGRDAALSVVMRLQQREAMLTELLQDALKREADLTDALSSALSQSC